MRRQDKVIELFKDVPIASKLCRKVGLFMSQAYGGYSLQAIAKHYGMQAPAVSQSNKRLRALIQQKKELKKQVAGIETKLKLSYV